MAGGIRGFAVPWALSLLLGVTEAAAQNVQFDGVYSGELGAARGAGVHSIQCYPVFLTLRVVNGSFEMKYDSKNFFRGNVGADGSVAASGQSAQLKGKISGATVSGDAWGPFCTHHLNLAKVNG